MQARSLSPPHPEEPRHQRVYTLWRGVSKDVAAPWRETRCCAVLVT